MECDSTKAVQFVDADYECKGEITGFYQYKS